MSTRNISWGWG